MGINSLYVKKLASKYPLNFIQIFAILPQPVHPGVQFDMDVDDLAAGVQL